MSPEQKKEFELIIKNKIWPFFESATECHNKSISFRIFARKGRVTGFKFEEDEPNSFGG